VGLPRANRLRKDADFRRVRLGGRSWANRLLVLGIAPNGLDHTRIGVIVGRRLGGAVQRNRVRRLISEAVRNRLDQISPGWDLVWIARLPLAQAKFAQVEQAVGQLLSRARLVKE
jgi:ribonuclease P protein component